MWSSRINNGKFLRHILTPKTNPKQIPITQPRNKIKNPTRTSPILQEQLERSNFLQ